MPENKPVVAAFDFDGTITYYDSLVPFLFFKFGFWKTVAGLTFLSPWFIGCGLRFITRDKTKERVAFYFFKGLHIEELRQSGKEYAEKVLPRKLRPEAVDRLRWHQARGDRTILVSASYDIYLQFWAEIMGFNDLLCSRLKLDQNGFVEGSFVEANCRAKEKVRRLQNLLGDKNNYVLYAYGDSEGDKELLEFADFSFYKSWPDLKK